MENNKNKRATLSIIGVALLLMALVGVTYSFFNYTRTGALNNLGTGRIYFNSVQNGTLNMTNIFPMTSSEAGNAQLDTVTVGIVGDTTYADGEEFEISLVDVTNTINGKRIPISYIATYEATTGNSIGTSSDTYWESRESKNADIYTLTETGSVEEGKQVLVGYIKNSATGINGTLTIKAYVDADRIAISDTYPEGGKYLVNSNMTAEELNTCITYLESFWDIEYNPLHSGETVENFCNGTGTAFQHTFQYNLDSGYFWEEELEYLEDHNIIIGYTDGTTDEWVNGRTVLTTSEWNSLQGNSAISFKIRAESNEGIWVEAPSKGIESCPDCKFMYTTNENFATWNNQSETPTQITSGLYDNYEELIATTGKNYFLGVKLNSNNEVTNAYACGVKDGNPFCIEGYSDNSKYNANKTLLNGVNLYNNTCTETVSYEGTENEYRYSVCGPRDNSGSLSAGADSYGNVDAGVSHYDYCSVGPNGYFACSESNSGGGGDSPEL